MLVYVHLNPFDNPSQLLACAVRERGVLKVERKCGKIHAIVHDVLTLATTAFISLSADFGNQLLSKHITLHSATMLVIVCVKQNRK